MAPESEDPSDFRPLLYSHLIARVGFFTRLAALAALLAGGLGLVGWKCGIPTLRMNPSIGFALILAGTSLALIHRAALSGANPGVGKMLGSLVMLLGLLTLFRNLFEMNATHHLANIAPIPSLCFVLLGIAFVASRNWRLPLTVGVIAFLSLVGYRWSFIGMQPLCSIALLLLSLGMLTLELESLIMQLDRENEKLRLRNEFREQFVSMLTHDLRSPLTAAKASAQLILRTIGRTIGRTTGRAADGNPPDLAKIQKLCHQIATTIARADGLIQDLLDANRIQAGHPMLVYFKPCELRQLLRTLLDELSLVHGDRFQLLVGEGNDTGYWDESALRRALENLVQNAIKYGADATPITVRAESSDTEVRINVHNEGNPIPRDLQEAIFEPFSRSPNVVRSGKKGWGIGLALVQAVAQAHSGKISVHSSQEYGTSFTLTLPRDPRSSSALEPARQIAS